MSHNDRVLVAREMFHCWGIMVSMDRDKHRLHSEESNNIHLSWFDKTIPSHVIIISSWWRIFSCHGDRTLRCSFIIHTMVMTWFFLTLEMQFHGNNSYELCAVFSVSSHGLHQGEWWFWTCGSDAAVLLHGETKHLSFIFSLLFLCFTMTQLYYHHNHRRHRLQVFFFV